MGLVVEGGGGVKLRNSNVNYGVCQPFCGHLRGEVIVAQFLKENFNIAQKIPLLRRIFYEPVFFAVLHFLFA